MIKEKTENDGWDFVYLSADFAAVQEARNMGIAHDKSLLFGRTAQGVSEAMGSLSERTLEKRRGQKSGFGFTPRPAAWARATNGINAGRICE